MSVSGMEAERGRVKREVTPRGGGHMYSLDVVESAEQVEQCDLLLVMIVCEPQTS